MTVKITSGGKERTFECLNVYVKEYVYFEKNGITPNSKAIVRIPAHSDLGLLIGDDLVVGNKKFTIVGITNNFDCKSDISHCKITARQ